jgi:large conductance mechanosensitive channel
MSILKEFKEFAIKGNVVDLAIAVVLGAAFGKVVSAVTDSIIAPILALILHQSTPLLNNCSWI